MSKDDENDRITVVDGVPPSLEDEDDDPVDCYDTLYAEWESLADAWVDRGVDAQSIWAFMLSVVLSVARENGLSLPEVLDICSRAWNKGDHIQ